MRPQLKPGDKVRLTGEFLRSTGQVVGGEGFSRWHVVACGCALCARDFVAVDEPSAFHAGQRHLRVANLERAR